MLVKFTQFGNQQTIQLCSIAFVQNNKFVYKILKGKAEAMCRKRLNFCRLFHATQDSCKVSPSLLPTAAQ